MCIRDSCRPLEAEVPGSGAASLVGEQGVRYLGLGVCLLLGGFHFLGFVPEKLPKQLVHQGVVPVILGAGGVHVIVAVSYTHLLPNAP